MGSPAPTRLDGTIIDGRYKLLSLVGQGGMCSVYRAQDQKRGLQVAVKVLPSERAKNQEMATRFQREASAGKLIQHPNVVSISDSGELEDGSLYLVMEFLEGHSLSTIVEKQKLPVDRAVQIAKQVLEGLEAAHQLGYAHRDVKPDNIMLVGEPGGEKAKLLDFGIALNERAAFKLTAVGLAFGTPEYLSPEMAMGLPTDARSDLYAVGVVLYQMVTGQLPFEGDQGALLRAHIDKKPIPPRALNKEVPPKLDEIILRALEKLPEKRFASARLMAADLDNVKRSSPWLAIAVGLAAALAAGWWWFSRLP
jgi:serine/threonine-protein kinase